MKRKWFIISIAVLIPLTLFTLYYCARIKYNKSVDVLYFYSVSGTIEDVLVYYFDIHGEYPVSIEAIIHEHEKESLENKDWLIYSYSTIDPLSRKEELLQYIPLYNRSGKRESFLILSAGADGKLNNHINHGDTLYLDSWWNELDVYNYFETILLNDAQIKNKELMALSKDVDINYEVPYPDFYKFHLWDYLFGKKDYIAQLGSKNNLTYFVNIATHP